jgi:hypothetical protein
MKLSLAEAMNARVAAMRLTRCLRPIQLALAHMAVNDQHTAVEYPAQPFDRFYPLMAWLHVLPVFDEWRSGKDFPRLMLAYRTSVSGTGYRRLRLTSINFRQMLSGVADSDGIRFHVDDTVSAADGCAPSSPLGVNS